MSREHAQKHFEESGKKIHDAVKHAGSRGDQERARIKGRAQQLREAFEARFAQAQAEHQDLIDGINMAEAEDLDGVTD